MSCKLSILLNETNFCLSTENKSAYCILQPDILVKFFISVFNWNLESIDNNNNNNEKIQWYLYDSTISIENLKVSNIFS